MEELLGCTYTRMFLVYMCYILLKRCQNSHHYDCPIWHIYQYFMKVSFSRLLKTDIIYFSNIYHWDVCKASYHLHFILHFCAKVYHLYMSSLAVCLLFYKLPFLIFCPHFLIDLKAYTVYWFCTSSSDF